MLFLSSGCFDATCMLLFNLPALRYRAAAWSEMLSVERSIRYPSIAATIVAGSWAVATIVLLCLEGTSSANVEYQGPVPVVGNALMVAMLTVWILRLFCYTDADGCVGDGRGMGGGMACAFVHVLILGSTFATISYAFSTFTDGCRAGACYVAYNGLYVNLLIFFHLVCLAAVALVLVGIVVCLRCVINHCSTGLAQIRAAENARRSTDTSQII